MTYDKRWDAIARSWLMDSALPAHLVMRHTVRLAQILHDHAEQFVADDLPELERDREAATEDAYWHRAIDEARGK